MKAKIEAGFKIIDGVQPYKMYEFTGKTESQNNMGHFQTLYEVKVFIKGKKEKWEFNKIDFINESFVNFLITNN